MHGWALAFLMIALVAGVAGFSGTAGSATSITWLLFIIGIFLGASMSLAGSRQPPAVRLKSTRTISARDRNGSG